MCSSCIPCQNFLCMPPIFFQGGGALIMLSCHWLFINVAAQLVICCWSWIMLWTETCYKCAKYSIAFWSLKSFAVSAVLPIFWSACVQAAYDFLYQFQLWLPVPGSTSGSNATSGATSSAIDFWYHYQFWFLVELLVLTSGTTISGYDFSYYSWYDSLRHIAVRWGPFII